MKIVILAGGLGSRLSEETNLKPKPLIEIGGKPILWHIMKIYSTYGINDFVICCGYKGYMIKEYFANYFLHMSDVTIDISNNKIEVHRKFAEPWKVTLVDTGLDTSTGGRLKRVENYLDNETFCFTYGDTVTNININDLISFHRQKKRMATVTACQPPGRFGILDLDGDKVKAIIEKAAGDGHWVNAGFFVLEHGVIDYIKGDDTVWELEPLQRLSQEGQLSVFKHTGFYQPIDTLRDKMHLEELWNSGKAYWKIW